MIARKGHHLAIADLPSGVPLRRLLAAIPGSVTAA
jgi:hypothetical protein